jgi:hypothetical protein
LESRDDHAAGSAADDQGGAYEAIAQPHAVRAGLLVVTSAIARELSGFVWAIAKHMQVVAA